MPPKVTYVCFACGKNGHIARLGYGDQYVCPLWLGYGDVTQPDADGRCGRCGTANFDYNNGYERARDGTRGYRCVNCGNIKPEDWRERCALKP